MTSLALKLKSRRFKGAAKPQPRKSRTQLVMENFMRGREGKAKPFQGTEACGMDSKSILDQNPKFFD